MSERVARLAGHDGIAQGGEALETEHVARPFQVFLPRREAQTVDAHQLFPGEVDHFLVGHGAQPWGEVLKVFVVEVSLLPGPSQEPFEELPLFQHGDVLHPQGAKQEIDVACKHRTAEIFHRQALVELPEMLPERAEFEHGAVRPSVDASLRGDELQEIVVERAALLCGLCSPSAQPVELVAVVGLRGDAAMHLVVFEHVVCRVFHLCQRTVYFGSGNALRVGRAAPALHLRRVPFLRANGISAIKLQHVPFPPDAHPDLAFARIPACIYLLQVKGDSSLNIHGT